MYMRIQGFIGVFMGVHEFEVLAFTSVGDGPNSSVVSERTMEDGKKIKH